MKPRIQCVLTQWIPGFIASGSRAIVTINISSPEMVLVIPMRVACVPRSRQTRTAGNPVGRTLLVHGRPALGEAHPLLTRARTLAERLGITVPYTLPALDEASLDLDV